MHPILAERTRLLAYLTSWVLLALLLAALLVVNGAFSWVEALALALPLSLIYGFAYLGAFWVCQAAPLGQATLLRVAGTQLAAGALSASLLLQVARGWAMLLDGTGLFPESLTRHGSAAAPLGFGVGLVLYLLVAALHYLLVAFEDSREAEGQALQFQILSREAELRALRAQIHPHFLFNALNSISALVVARPEEARRVCILLADFLRRSLTFGTRDRVSFADELSLAEDLLAIEKVRFGAHFVPVMERGRFASLIRHGLETAGCKQTLLSDSGLELLRQGSQGIPRKAGLILKTAMRLAVPKGLSHLPDELINDAMEEIK